MGMSSASDKQRLLSWEMKGSICYMIIDGADANARLFKVANARERKIDRNRGVT